MPGDPGNNSVEHQGRFLLQKLSLKDENVYLPTYLPTRQVREKSIRYRRRRMVEKEESAWARMESYVQTSNLGDTARLEPRTQEGRAEEASRSHTLLRALCHCLRSLRMMERESFQTGQLNGQMWVGEWPWQQHESWTRWKDFKSHWNSSVGTCYDKSLNCSVAVRSRGGGREL